VSAPWLSVIMPTFNGAAYLATTLASIECQQDDQIEVIAVDDGSSDATLSILQGRCGRLPLRVIASGRVGNWAANTNIGLAEARGKYACFLHQDDLWLPGRLQVVRRLLAQAPRSVLLLHPARYIDAQGRDLGVWRCPLPAGHNGAGLITEQLLVQNFIAVPAPVFAREAALRVGLLDETLWYTADWDFWLKLAATEPAMYYPRPLAAFRIHSQSQTAQGVARAAEMRRQIEAVLQKHLPPWEAAHPGRVEVGQTARMSLEVNHALAGWAHGTWPNGLSLACKFLALGLRGWFRFFRDSRLVERVTARLRAKC
jgi:GT2 family glycosyltransferase